jgi:hypothetical protein
MESAGGIPATVDTRRRRRYRLTGRRCTFTDHHRPVAMDTILLRTYRFRHEADVDRAVLESSGIPTVIVGDDIGGMGAHIMTANPIRLYVPAEAASDAQAVLSEGESTR